jgi:hypothetical protein
MRSPTGDCRRHAKLARASLSIHLEPGAACEAEVDVTAVAVALAPATLLNELRRPDSRLVLLLLVTHDPEYYNRASRLRWKYVKLLTISEVIAPQSVSAECDRLPCSVDSFQTRPAAWVPSLGY